MRFAMALAMLLALMIPAQAADPLVVKESKHSVKVTLNRLEKALISKGIKIMGRIDHSAGATAAGLELPETELLIFGNPKLGTQLMKANRQIANDLPMKVLVWKADNGKVFLGYTPPSALKERFAVTGHDAIFDQMAKALDAFTNEAVATN